MARFHYGRQLTSSGLSAICGGGCGDPGVGSQGGGGGHTDVVWTTMTTQRGDAWAPQAPPGHIADRPLAVLDAETTSRFAELPSGLRLHYHEAGDPAAETVLL